jgi:predicted nucleic acid-binding Zn finger protein
MIENEKSEIETLNAICREAKNAGKLSGGNLTDLYELFGQRFTKALDAVKEGRVKRYIFHPSDRVVWIVVGRERDYLIMPEAEFCTCDDFYFRVLDKKVHMCYHLLTQKIAQNLGWFEIFEENDDCYDMLMNEWKKSSLKTEK